MRHSSNAQEQQQSVQTVQLQNGQEATVLVPDLNVDDKLVIIDMKVLKFLSELLPKASLEAIVNTFAAKLNYYADGFGDYRDTKLTMAGYIAMLTEEAKFHASVNMVCEYFAPKEEPKVIEVIE